MKPIDSIQPRPQSSFYAVADLEVRRALAIENHVYNLILDSMSEDLKLAMMAGCPIEHEYHEGTFTIRTKNKVGIARLPGGKVQVSELVDDEIKSRASFKEIRHD